MTKKTFFALLDSGLPLYQIRIWGEVCPNDKEKAAESESDHFKNLIPIISDEEIMT